MMTEPRQPDVLIVRPVPSRGLGAFYRSLGVTLLANHLGAHGLRPRLVDITFEPLPTELGSSIGAALFSLFIDDFSQGLELAGALKRSNPSLFTVVGGPHATLLGASVFDLGDAFDVVCVGDCMDEALPVVADLVRRMAQPRRQLISAKSGTAKMDVHGPDFSIWPSGRYFPVFPLEISRGCHQHCPFCTDPVLRRGVATDPVERTMATIRGLVSAHGTVWIRFVDASLTSLGKDLDRLLDALRDAQLPVQWSAYGYPHDITEELAGRLADSGCVAMFLGIESLGDGVFVGKHHTKRPGDVVRAVESLQRNGVFVHGNFIVGLPGETRRSMQETQRAVATLNLDSVGGGPFFLTPGSTFDLAPQRFGIHILDAKWPLRQHIGFYDSEYEYFRTTTLTQHEMRDLARDFKSYIESNKVSCWNLSDYALLCWLSIGGHTSDLVRLWQAPPSALSSDQAIVLNILKEKRDAPPPPIADRFVELAGAVARSGRASI